MLTYVILNLIRSFDRDKLDTGMMLDSPTTIGC